MLQLHSHKPPILHRDLKSPNLLVDKHWRVKVTDFNLSSKLHLQADSNGLDSSIANNPRWLAPEVCDMGLPSSIAVDACASPDCTIAKTHGSFGGSKVSCQ